MKNVSVFVLSILLAVSSLSAFPEKKVPSIYYNPLSLNGRTLLPEQFSVVSKGKLSMVIGNPESADATKIPCVLQLKRDGKIINTFKSLAANDIEVSNVLAYAKAGDEIVIESAASDVKIVRVLKVKPYIPTPYFKWFPTPKKNGDGC